MSQTSSPFIQKSEGLKSMSLVPGTPNPYVAAFTGNLLYCFAFSYVAGCIAGVGAGFRKEIIATLTTNSSRKTAYAPIGGAVGILTCWGRYVADDNESDLSIGRKRWRWN